MPFRLSLSLMLLLALPCCLLLSLRASAQDEEATSAGFIDFRSDVEPVLRAKCLECHGPDEAKNDFRVDDPEWMLSYVESGDLESSSLWTDYLITDDPDMQMPPADKPGLTGSEFAALKLWIEEGAAWPEDAFAVEEDEANGATAADLAGPAEETKSLQARIWIFQGLFHPASVHFPIALLSVSALFCFLSFFSRKSFEPAAYHCLWIGALGAILASVMGWGYAQYEGYGAGFSFDLGGRAIDRHRWLGIAVAVGAVVLVFLARSVRKSEAGSKRGLWFLGSICLLLGVSITGYQGGELTYGEDHYQKEFSRLFPTAFATEAANGDESPTTDEEPLANSEPPADSETPADEEQLGEGASQVAGGATTPGLGSGETSPASPQTNETPDQATDKPDQATDEPDQESDAAESTEGNPPQENPPENQAGAAESQSAAEPVESEPPTGEQAGSAPGSSDPDAGSTETDNS